MNVTGVGTAKTYYYNANTNKLYSKETKETDDFAAYYNEEETDSTKLNYFDIRMKNHITNFVKDFLNSNYTNDENIYELSFEIKDAFTDTINIGNFSVTGYTSPDLTTKQLDKFLDSYIDEPEGNYRFKGHPELEGLNQLSLKRGDIFSVHRDYSLKILNDRVIVLNSAGKEDTTNQEAMNTAKVFDLLIRYSNGEITPDKVTGINDENFNSLCILLKNLGIDTEKEFTINNVSSTLKDGYLKELNNPFGYSQELLKEIERDYEMFLYQHIHN